MIRRIHHVAISTPDIERLSAFYRDALGFDVEMEMAEWRPHTATGDRVDGVTGLKRSAGKVLMLRKGGMIIEFFEFRSPKPRIFSSRRVCDCGFTHICLVVDDLDSEFNRLKNAGMRFHTPPSKDSLGGLRAVYGRDPDGNVIELLEYLPVRTCISPVA
ncbi:MAG: VOC family protein [Desulfobacterales bacterium]